MPLTFPHDCPHCGTKKIGFVSVFNWNPSRINSRKDILALCNGCSNGVVFRFSLNLQSSEFDFIKSGTGDLKSNEIRTLDYYPRQANFDIPEHLPDQVSSLYSQAQNCIRQGLWDAAGMTLRKVLEVSTKLLDPSLSTQTLSKRIEKLFESGAITKDIKDWAHEIRLDGNDAAHEEELFDEKKSNDLKLFVYSYLTYVHTLPQMVQINRTSRVT